MSTTRVERRVHAGPERVYALLLDPEAVAEWMVPDGMSSVVHEFDARPGGRFRISLTYDSAAGTGKTTARTDTSRGRFVTLVPGETVVQAVEFETSDPALHGESIITYTLTAADAGAATDVLAVHENLPPGVPPADNELGFAMSLAKLADLAERR